MQLGMKIKNYLLLFLLSFLVYSCSISPEYNLNFNPPANDAKPIDIFPESIGLYNAKVENPAYGGTKVFYGKNMSIYVGRLSNKAEAIAFFKKYLLIDFKSCPNNFSGNVNGQYFARGKSENTKLFGWVNQNYVFVIGAANEAEFNQIVINFKYISK